MTHKQSILETFQRYSNRMTLGELLEEGRYSFSHKLTARISELRRDLESKGYTIQFRRGKKPTENEYSIVVFQRFPVVEGQGVMFEEAI